MTTMGKVIPFPSNDDPLQDGCSAKLRFVHVQSVAAYDKALRAGLTQAEAESARAAALVLGFEALAKELDAEELNA